MDFETIYFSHARTAFKYGLLMHKLKENDQVLVPKYICDSIIRPLEFLKIKPNFYKVLKNLKPDWKDIQKKFNSNTKAILAVHYFGEPQNLNNFLQFTSEKKILLIEDNAHGWGSTYNSKNLGEIGDFSFSSPRKIINIKSGGILRIKKKVNLQLKDFKEYNNFLNLWQYKSLLKALIKSNPYLYRLLKRQPKYWDLDAFREKEILDLLSDRHSIQKIMSTNLNLLKTKRRIVYEIWKNFIERNTNLQPVYSNLNIETSPFVFPAYTQSIDESRKYFNWGWKNGFEISSWPTFPEKIKNDKDILSIWEKLICFPINDDINPTKLKTRLEFIEKNGLK